MRILSLFNCFLLLYFSTHVSVEHGEFLSHTEIHSHGHKHEHHSHSHDQVELHEEDHHHDHIDHDHLYPSYLRSQQDLNHSFDESNLIIENNLKQVSLSIVFVNSETLLYSDLPPPRSHPLYTMNQSFLL